MSSLIVSDPNILSGTPVFIGTRVPVAVVFENLADGLSLEEILDAYPTLDREQVVQVLQQAEQLVEERAAPRMPPEANSAG